MNPRPVVIYVDIDDTLVRSFGSKRIPMGSVIEAVRKLHADGAILYAWSSGGGEYARSSAQELELEACFSGFLPKPHVLIDDQEVAAWRGTLTVHPNEAAQLTVEDYLRRLAWIPPAQRSELTVLFRPVGPTELALIAASGHRRFPARLPEQPIFYPVCNEPYAREIAEQWNVAASGSGFVTRFSVRSEFLAAYERHIVGGRQHEEYWIPAEHLEAFNDAIVGEIEVIASFAPRETS